MVSSDIAYHPFCRIRVDSPSKKAVSVIVLPKDIRQQMVELIDELQASPNILIQLRGGDGPEKRRAVAYLADMGALVEISAGYRLTAYATRVRRQLIHPLTAWLSDNWFPVGVLVVAVLVGVGTIVSNVI